MELTITKQEREYLRELAKKQLEYSQLDIMKQREKLWYEHNACRGVKPLIIMEWGTFAQDMLNPRCQSPLAKQVERRIMDAIVAHEQIDDDEVVPAWYEHAITITEHEFGMEIKSTRATDMNGRAIGYHWDYPIKDIAADFDKLGPFRFEYDAEAEKAKIAAIGDILGDILPIRVSNEKHMWFFMLTAKLLQLVGMEQWMLSMYEEPEQVHRLMRYITDNCKYFVNWQDENNLLTMNNGNHFTGAGSRGFTNELKMPADGHVRPKNMWINLNSQESSSISPAMYKEFVYPYIAEIAEMFGMVYYGCCEPVDPIWDCCLKDLPNLRKVSISAWCNEDIMGEKLRGGKIVYSRKPSPHFLGVDPTFDEEGYREYMKHTLRASRGCDAEIIFRDVYTTMNDPTRPRKAVKILRELIEDEWGK